MNRTRAWISLSISLILLAGSVLVGCDRQERAREYAARVGDSYLFLDEIELAASPEHPPSKAQLREYVAQWITNELLYQEARRRGYESSAEVKNKLREVQKQLSIQQFLQTDLFHETTDIEEDSIRAFFEASPNDFLLQEDMVRISYAGFAQREIATVFRGHLVRGHAWEDAIDAVVSETAGEDVIIAHAYDQYYTQTMLYPPELWRVAVSLSPGEVSFPIRSQGGFFVVRLLAHHKHGTRAEFEMVREEIRQRLLMDRRRERYNELVAQLQSRYPVEVRIP